MSSLLALFLPLASLSAGELSPSVDAPVTGLARTEDGWSGAGADWVAQFTPGLVRVAAGQDETGERPGLLEYRFLSAELGGQPVHEASAPLTATRQGDAVEYQHSAVFVERYDLLAEGLEQSFVLHELPAGYDGTGDLVVHGELTSTLPLRSADAFDGLRFGAPEHGPEHGMVFGGVTGIDAAGRTVRGTVEFDGLGLELRLPAAFVATAELPLVLDPLIGSGIGTIVANSNFDEVHSDVAYIDGGWLVVWERENTATISTVWGRFYNSNGSANGTAFLIASGPISNESPTAGCLRDVSGPYFLVAYEHDDLFGGDKDIRVSSIEFGDPGSLSSAVLTDTTEGGDEIEPDIGRGYLSTPLVYVSNGNIKLRNVVRNLGTGVPLSLNTAIVDSGSNLRAPSIDKSANAMDVNFCVWDAGSTIGGRIWEGTTPGGDDPVFTVFSGSTGVSRPDVAGANEDDYLVVWSQLESGSIFLSDVRARRVTFRGPGVDAATLGPVVDIEADSGELEGPAAVCFTGGSYLVIYTDFPPGPGSLGNLRFQTLDRMNLNALEDSNVIGGMLAAPQAVAVDAGLAFQGGTDSAIQVMSWTRDGGGSELDVYLRAATRIGSLGTPITGVGCPILGGEARVSTNRQNNPQFRHELWYGEPAAFAILAWGFAASPVPIPLGDAKFVPLITFTLAINVGVTDPNGYVGIETPIPGGVAGAQLWDQWVVFSAGQGCTGIALTNLSDAINYEILF